MSQDLLICIGDGDNIGNAIEFYLLAGDLGRASQFSFQVTISLIKIAKKVQTNMSADLIYVAGDDICFTVNNQNYSVDKLNLYSNIFFEETGKSLSFGVGKTPVEAVICLRKAKVSGKGCIVSSGVNM
jgi:hypothetical protein